MTGHPIRQILGARGGIPSFCTAADLALEAVFALAARRGRPALVEATANQVNQSGGYTGMRPAEFAAFVRGLADKAGLPPKDLILGGDHLGPLPWRAEHHTRAMDQAEELVRLYAAAGFGKLHLDTSMALGGDSGPAPPLETVAARGARLARAALSAWRGPGAPVFVIGSEVPPAGGAPAADAPPTPTDPADFARTVAVYREVFLREGLEAAWEHVIAVVVQPGAEFSGSRVFPYDSARAAALSAALAGHPGLAFEGHSTDYQPLESLRAMVQDGVAILKVGPELTFAVRQALFGLSFIEDALLPARSRSGFRRALDRAMRARPEHWRPHTPETGRTAALMRRYSLADRSRYYMAEPAVAHARARLLENIDGADIPPGLLMQFLPLAGPDAACRRRKSGREWVRAHVTAAVLERYFAAAFGDG